MRKQRGWGKEKWEPQNIIFFSQTKQHLLLSPVYCTDGDLENDRGWPQALIELTVQWAMGRHIINKETNRQRF